MSTVNLPALSRRDAWTYDDEIAELGDAVRAAAGSLRTHEEDGYGDDFWKKIVDLGWHSVLLEDKYGGLGLDGTALAGVVAPLAAEGCSHAYSGTAVDAIALLQACASDATSSLLEGIAAGSLRPQVALAESPSAPYPRTPLTQVARDGAGWVLNGRKALVPYAAVANGYIVLAQDTESGQSTLLYVEAEADGVDIVPQETYGVPLGDVTFDDVAVPESGWLAAGPVVEAGLASSLDLAAAIDAVALVAIGSEALALTLTYTGDRVQFDKPLAAFQAVQHHCSNAFLLLEESRMLTRDALAPRQDPVARAWASSLAAVKAGEGVIEVMRLAHRLHGGIGFYSDYPLEALTRKAVTIQGLHGSVAWHRQRLAALVTDVEHTFERGELRSRSAGEGVG